MASIGERIRSLWQLIWTPEEDETMKYPIEADTRRILLPSDIRSQLREEIEQGYKQDAVLRVQNMTGAEPEEAAEYIERLERSLQRRRYR